MTNTTNTTAPCANCNATGFLGHFAHIADGVCFTCHGTGRVAPASKAAAPVYTLDDVRSHFVSVRKSIREDGYADTSSMVYLGESLFQVAGRDAALAAKVLSAVKALSKSAAVYVATHLTEWRYFCRLDRATQEVVLAAAGPMKDGSVAPWKWGKEKMEAVKDWTWAAE